MSDTCFLLIPIFTCPILVPAGAAVPGLAAGAFASVPPLFAVCFEQALTSSIPTRHKAAPDRIPLIIASPPVCRDPNRKASGRVAHRRSVGQRSASPNVGAIQERLGSPTARANARSSPPRLTIIRYYGFPPNHVTRRAARSEAQKHDGE